MQGIASAPYRLDQITRSTLGPCSVGKHITGSVRLVHVRMPKADRRRRAFGSVVRSTHGRRHARIPPPPPRLPPRLPRPRRCRRLGPYAALLHGRITLVRAPRITHASHPEQEQEFLDIHEYVRNRYASPPAALGTTLDRPRSSRLIPAGSMQTLTWNDTISAEAQVRCIRGLD